MIKRKRLTQRDYDQIKTLANVGVPLVKIVQVTSRGASTVARIVSSESFAGYKKSRNEDYKKWVARVATEKIVKQRENQGQALMQTLPEPSLESIMIALVDIQKQLSEIELKIASR